MNKIFDWHVWIAVGGIGSVFALDHISTFFACIAGAATSCYMILRAMREWIKFRRDEKSLANQEQSQPGCKNYEPK